MSTSALLSLPTIRNLKSGPVSMAALATGADVVSCRDNGSRDGTLAEVASRELPLGGQPKSTVDRPCWVHARVVQRSIRHLWFSGLEPGRCDLAASMRSPRLVIWRARLALRCLIDEAEHRSRFHGGPCLFPTPAALDFGSSRG